jgi:microcystin-dependent protein
VSPGTVAHLARATAPVGWLKANGALINRVTYAALFAAIGTTYGVGDGSTTFAVPDLRGEFIRGWDDAKGTDAGRALNAVVQLDGIISHTHPILAIATGGRSAGHTHTTAVSGTTGGVSANHTHSFSDTSSATGNASANHTHEPSTVANSFATNLPTAGTGIAITSSSFATASVATTSASGAAHTHTVAVSGTTGGNSVGHTHTFADNASSSGTESVDHTHTTPATNTVAQSGGLTETRPRNLAMLACIKY